MTSFFHDLEEQLRTAAHQRLAEGDAPRRLNGTDEPPRPRRRRWLAGGARLLPVLVAVGVTLAVVVGALVLLGHRGGHRPTPPASGGPDNAFAALVEKTPRGQLKRESAFIAAASKNVANRPACRPPTANTGAIVRGAAPGKALLSTLGVLRRPATPADRIDPKLFGLGGPGMTFYLDGTRHARTIGKTAYYVVPIHVTPVGDYPSAACAALQAQALKQSLPTIPAKLRGPTVALQAALIDYDRRLSRTTPQDGVCILSRAGRGNSSECGEPLSAIRRPMVPSDDGGSYSGVVPDGVASVTLSFPATASHAATSVTGAVRDNLFVVRGPRTPTTVISVPTVTWRAADGRVLKRLTPPSPASLKTLCLNHPETCAPYSTSSVGSSSGPAAKVSARPVGAGTSGTASKQK